MPVQLQIIRASEFICIDADEHLDFEASKQLLHGLVLTCQKRGLDRAMLDLRDTPVPDRPYFSTSEIAALAGEFRIAGFARHQRLAILYKEDVYGGVRNFAFFSKLRGLQVQAFHNFEQAVLWLSKEPSMEHLQGADVPIRHGVKKRLASPAARIHIWPHQPTRRPTKGNHG